MSAGGGIVWGEPYDHCGHIQRLADTLRALDGEWPPEGFFLEAREKVGEIDLQTEWIANLYPSVDDLKASHRAFLDRLFDHPARERGYDRWDRRWYERWPDRPVLTPGASGRHWARLAKSFLERSAELDARLIRFEDLIAGRVNLGELSTIPSVESRLPRRAVSPVARALGYDPSA